MAGSQSHRSGDAHAPASGTCNRSFVSSDPERQREPVTNQAPRSKAEPPGGFAFGVRRPPGAVRSARQKDAPEAPVADAAPQGRGRKRRG